MSKLQMDSLSTIHTVYRGQVSLSATFVLLCSFTQVAGRDKHCPIYTYLYPLELVGGNNNN